ncbi:MAG: MurR/RpiR family transcriptional regulator [Propylenella sp.]
MSSDLAVDELAPRDFDGLRTIVGKRLPRLPKRLSQVGRYALDHPDEIAFGTAASIAEAAEVQPSTLVRFAREFGYSGFSDLQRVFRQRLRDRPSAYSERLAALKESRQAGLPELAILDGFLGAASRSIDKLAHAVDSARFSRAVNILAQADTIFLVARRRAYPLTSYMDYAFGKLGVRTQMVSTPNRTDAEVAALARPTDAAISVSFTPYSDETIALSRALADAEVPLVAITDGSFSPLAECAAEWLEVSEADHAGFRSLSASMALCMALTVAVASRRQNALE